MNAERSLGMVLRTRLLTETSLIVNWLTPELGRISTVAKGARRPKSPFRGKVDLLYEADFSFQRSPRSTLHPLREVSIRESFPGLRRDIDRLSQAAYLAALIEQTTETETPLEGIYPLFRWAIGAVERYPLGATFVLAFELRLLELLGLGVDPAASRLTSGSQKVVHELQRQEGDVLSRLALSELQVIELTRFQHGYLVRHLDRIPRGRARALGGAGKLEVI